MSITRDAIYAHRHNHDGTFDSICRRCFATVCRAKNETNLANYEKNHSCERSILVDESLDATN